MMITIPSSTWISAPGRSGEIRGPLLEPASSLGLFKSIYLSVVAFLVGHLSKVGRRSCRHRMSGAEEPLSATYMLSMIPHDFHAFALVDPNSGVCELIAVG
jgi:hypothetical protein